MSVRRRGWPFGRGRRSGAADGAPAPGAASPQAATAVPCEPCEERRAAGPSGAFALNLSPSEVIPDHLVPTLRAGVADAIVGTEVVLFDPDRSRSTLLNPSAALIWASIDGRTSVAGIVDDLVAETGVDRSVIDDDVRTTIARLQVVGVVDAPDGDRGDPDHPAASGPPGHTDGDPARLGRLERRDRRVRDVLDRTTWLPGAGPRWCSALTVEVRTDDPEVAAVLGPALDHLAPAPEAAITVSVVGTRAEAGARRYRVLTGTELRTTATSAAGAAQAVFGALNDLVATRSTGHVLLHAGAVARGDDVVVVAGPSGHGKSTLTAALVRHGFDYLTDEVVAIEPAHRVVRAYAKPLDLDLSSRSLLALEPGTGDRGAIKTMVAPEQVGRARAEGGRVALIVLLRDPAADPDGPEPTAAETLVGLLGNTFAATFDPSAGVDDPLGALAALASDVPVLHLDRQPPADAASVVAAALDAAVAGRHRPA